MYTVFVVETTTGKTIGTLPCIIQSWADPLGSIPTATVNLAPGSMTGLNTNTRDWYRLITTPWRMSLVIDWDGIPVWAGPITGRQFDGKKPIISALGIRAIFDHRKVHDWSTPYNAWSVTYTGQSLGSIAVNLVNIACAAGKPGASLPILVPTGESDTDPTHQRTYTGYALADVGTELDNLTASLNGPDIHFLPQWVDSTRAQIVWVMRVGTLAQPYLASAATVQLDASSPNSSIAALTSIDDASKITTTDWAQGTGSGAATLISKSTSSTLPSQGWPLLESENDYRTVTDQPTLDSHTLADQQTFGRDVIQWTISVNALQPPVLGSYLLGDNALIRVAGHLWIPDSPAAGYPMRIIQISGDNTPIVKLDVQ